jgi:hypothetical protein
MILIFIFRVESVAGGNWWFWRLDKICGARRWRVRNCSSGCVVRMPGGVIGARADAGSLDSVAASLREAVTPLGMTILGWIRFAPVTCSG